jgi:membrane fusion protein, multidrug efflux system
MAVETKHQLDQSVEPVAPPSFLGKFLRISGCLLVAGLFLAGGASGIAILHSRAAAELPPQPASPVSVATMTVTLVPGYQRTSSYVGRLEPARQTQLAFERAGLVIDIVPEEGERVRAGDVIARMDTAQLTSTRKQLLAQRRALEAQRDLAKATLRRQTRLKTKGWSPHQRFDEAESNLEALVANIEQVSARIGSIDIDIAKSVLKAPFSGIVAKRSIDEGAVIMSGAPVLNLLESGRRRARIGLPPEQAETIRTDREYTLRAGLLEQPAKLISRRPDLENGTQTVTMLFELTNEKGQISFGELVTLELNSPVHERGAWVPLAALKEGRRGLWTVLVVSSDEGQPPIVQPEAVELLYANAERAFVRGTFTSGAKIISSGTSRIVAGQRVALVQE